MITAALAVGFAMAAMQVGPNPRGDVDPIPEELRELRRRQRSDAPIVPDEDRMAACLARSQTGSVATVVEAAAWADGTDGQTKANALHCKGVAEIELGRFAEAAASFETAVAALSGNDAEYAARLGAMAGGAHLLGGDAARAATVLEQAKLAAEQGAPALIAGQIDLDRAKAYVAMDDTVRAQEALADARRTIPRDPQSWLLSATLARRLNDLPLAQDFITQARALVPARPELLLEAGLIAVLNGDDEQARRDWTAILDAPDPAPEAQTARFYLEQLDTP
ncbi:MAG: hypothetical protein WA948_00800 [Pontixanthobacter sp.]